MTPIKIKSSQINLPIEKISKIFVADNTVNELIESLATGSIRLETLPNVVEPNGLIDGATVQYDAATENWVVNNTLDGGEF
jgi:hypothetical protein